LAIQRNISHVEDAVGALSVKLTPEEINKYLLNTLQVFRYEEVNGND
jgi:hypothetical protein